MLKAYRQSPSPQKVILLVEDESPFVERIRSALQEKGFRVVYATSCAQGLDYLAKVQRLDAIWLDHYLEGEKTGLDFLFEARKIPKGQHIPVFVVSNAAEKQQEYLRCGITEYFPKVSRPLSEIVFLVKKLLER